MKNMEKTKKRKETGIISKYKKTTFCRKLLIVGRVRVHVNDSNEGRLASKFKI